MIQLPKYSLIEKNTLGSTCDGCGRTIKNVYKLRNNQTQEVGEFGSGCAKNFMQGKTITEVAKEGEAYKRALLEEDIRLEGANRIEEFKELYPEMLAYISENQDFSFLVSMKEAIERYGVLTQKQFDVIYGMMLKPAKLEDKIKDFTLSIFRVKIAHNDFGTNYTLLGETEDHELVRVYFSSLTIKNEDILRDKGVLRTDSTGDVEFIATTDNPKQISVSGSFDGYNRHHRDQSQMSISSRKHLSLHCLYF